MFGREKLFSIYSSAENDFESVHIFAFQIY